MFALHVKLAVAKEVSISALDPKTFDVKEKNKIELTNGDKILIQANLKDYKHNEHRLTNGEILTVAEILENENIKNKEEKIIPSEFTSMDYGYAMTFYTAQGKICDHVIVNLNIAQGKALTFNQFYVSTSRGRESLSIYVDDKDYIKENLKDYEVKKEIRAKEEFKVKEPKTKNERHHAVTSRLTDLHCLKLIDGTELAGLKKRLVVYFNVK